MSSPPERPGAGIEMRPAPAGPLPRPTGVIHDIGYRRYDGQRLGRGYVVVSLFTQSLRSSFGLGRTAKSKVLPFLLAGIMLLPAAILVAVLIFAGLEEQPLPYTRYAMVLQAAIGIYLASQAPQLFSRDLRFRTVTLYFSRPLTRLDYVVAKYAALVAALFMLMVAPLLVLYVGGLLAKLPFGGQTEGLLFGITGALLFALVLAGFGAVIASLTTRRGFGIAAIITVLVVSFAAVNAVAGIAQEQGNEDVAAYAGLFSPFTLVDGVQVIALDAQTSAVQGPPDGALGTLAFVLTTAVVVVGSFGLLLLRYRKVAQK